ncbi:hypothetical protein GF326_04165 [Candidatus Bathyarchaeota archaeon]|nr:hypothetical protein [Candidatus Bathyarchaeota archaeon]
MKKYKTVRLVGYTLFFSLFTWLIIEDEYNWLEKAVNLVLFSAIGYGVRTLSKLRMV